jgi:hypothetical protein
LHHYLIDVRAAEWATGDTLSSGRDANAADIECWNIDVGAGGFTVTGR